MPRLDRQHWAINCDLGWNSRRGCATNDAMKSFLLTVTIAAMCLFLTACAGDGDAPHGESRISGRAGVAISSHQLAPPVGRRPGDQLPAN